MPFPGSRRQGGIYVASRVFRAPMWLELRSAGWPIVSSWLDESGIGQTQDRGELILRCLREAAEAERLVWYAEPGDFPFKLAWGEACVAVYVGVPTFLVGPEEVTEAMWAGLPRVGHVRRVQSVIEAFEAPLTGGTS